MAALTNPSEIARETLRRLAVERIPPTPENYKALYASIAGAAPEAAVDPAEKVAADLVAALPRDSEESARTAAECEQGLKARNWDLVGRLLTRQITSRETFRGWNELLVNLIEIWESPQPALTAAQQRKALGALLKTPQMPEQLARRLQFLLHQGRRTIPADQQRSAPDGEAGRPLATSAIEPPSVATGEVNAHILALRELCAFLLDTPLAASLGINPALAEEARALGRKTRDATSPDDVEALLPQVRRLAMRVEMVTEDQHELMTGVLHLLRLVIDNIGELVIDDRWLDGQLAMLREILAQPLDVRLIDNAERRLRDVIVKQSNMKAGLAEAQRSFKSLLNEFVGQLASFARETGAYHAKIDSFSERIGHAQHALELQDVVQDLLRETKSIQTTAQRTHGELLAARAQVEEAERRVATLEAELATTGELIRQDPLTGMLNRRGLQEVLGKEIARAERRQAPLCLAVLDVDNFKQLNDALGHQAGDDALIHLSTVIRLALRPQDTVARYGGEEFVILLPETTGTDGREAIVRVQRELTKKFFLHNNQRILITFSAGVTEIPTGETAEAAISRADQLMYRAKQAGKNKVFTDG